MGRVTQLADGRSDQRPSVLEAGRLREALDREVSYDWRTVGGRGVLAERWSSAYIQWEWEREKARGGKNLIGFIQADGKKGRPVTSGGRVLEEEGWAGGGVGFKLWKEVVRKSTRICLRGAEETKLPFGTSWGGSGIRSFLGRMSPAVRWGGRFAEPVFVREGKTWWT